MNATEILSEVERADTRTQELYNLFYSEVKKC